MLGATRKAGKAYLVVFWGWTHNILWIAWLALCFCVTRAAVRLCILFRLHRKAAMQFLTTLMIRLTSRQVGKDRLGNTYWEARSRRDSYGRPMRRVLFAKEAQASAVPAEWWGWLHHTTEQPLPEDAPRRAWQKEHRPNMTGTAEAWRPANPAAQRGGDYEAWTPGR